MAGLGACADPELHCRLRDPAPTLDARQTAGIELFEAPALSDANY
jgi:hypothetical protein